MKRQQDRSCADYPQNLTGHFRDWIVVALLFTEALDLREDMISKLSEENKLKIYGLFK